MSLAAVTGRPSPPGLRSVELSIRGMTCAACAARVEKKLGGIDDVSAMVNFGTQKATIVVPPSVPVERLIGVVEQAGYQAELTGPPGDAGHSGANVASGAAMAASSAFVVANSVRLRRFAATGPAGRRQVRPAGLAPRPDLGVTGGDISGGR